MGPILLFSIQLSYILWPRKTDLEAKIRTDCSEEMRKPSRSLLHGPSNTVPELGMVVHTVILAT
jgi:hypothetical protein